MRKAWVAIALAMVTALAAAATATAADIVESEPGGEITMTSLGRIVLANEIVRVECPMTLRGRFFESARGNLTGTLTARPQIGQITSGTVGACNTNTSARLLFEGIGQWLLFTNGISEPNRYNLNLLNFQFLIRALGVYECLYNVLLGLSYDGNLIRVTSIATLSFMRLIGSGTCPLAPPAVSGTWDLSPDQELILRSEI